MIDRLIEHFGGLGQSNKFGGECTKAVVFDTDCLLVKPQSFMNLSGRCVNQVLAFYKVPPRQLIVVYDDLDLPFGKVKARVGGGHGGHNGVRSILQEIGDDGFHRIKLGIGRPDGQGEKPRLVHDWVLSKLSEEEIRILQEEMLKEVLLRLKPIVSAT
jgi:PTH1 family peptidyl-tRNA hydrolase